MRSHVVLGLLFGAALALTTARRSAGATAACPVHLQAPRSIPSTWRAAAANVETRLRSEWDARDCARIDIVLDIEGAGAKVDFVSHSGAQAERHVGNPGELAPTVQALVTILDPPLVVQIPPATAESSKSGADSPPAPAPESGSRSLRWNYGAGLGIRAGRAGTAIASLALQGYVTLGLSHWELGLMGAWEPSYRRTATAADDGDVVQINTSAIAAAVMAGRREVLGAWEMTYGATLGGAAVDGDARSDDGSRDADRLSARWGAYLGAAAPRYGSLRFRAWITGDFSPGQTPEARGNWADLPSWMGMAFLGVEMGTP